jgi:hypothetical protein
LQVCLRAGAERRPRATAHRTLSNPPIGSQAPGSAAGAVQLSRAARRAARPSMVATRSSSCRMTEG